jgi:hypothetical protein
VHGFDAHCEIGKLRTGLTGEYHATQMLAIDALLVATLGD